MDAFMHSLKLKDHQDFVKSIENDHKNLTKKIFNHLNCAFLFKSLVNRIIDHYALIYV